MSLYVNYTVKDQALRGYITLLGYIQVSLVLKDLLLLTFTEMAPPDISFIVTG